MIAYIAGGAIPLRFRPMGLRCGNTGGTPLSPFVILKLRFGTDICRPLQQSGRQLAGFTLLL